jgi:hypothetical protein
MSESPVVPLGDGRWVPTCAPWAEARGPLSLYVEAEPCFTHGAMPVRDSLLGPLYLILQEVVEPKEQAADWLVNYHCELLHQRNAAFSQPYYSPHPLAHLKRGEVKAFLKAYYNMVSALADRETYTFWEHLYHLSPHKTHEEGWFLMQTRWMLWMEEADKGVLNLMPGVPRRWLRDGEVIELREVCTYFGKVGLRVQSRVDKGVIELSVDWDRKRAPEVINIRIPHPEGKRAVRVIGGEYLAESEVVRLRGKAGAGAGRAEVSLRF